jgi:nucleotide-binding universal stress UspA family protein
MSYKTILVHVDKSRNAAERIRLAVTIAARCDAHLTGAALTGISRFVYQSGLINDNDPNLASHLDEELNVQREGAAQALADFARLAQRMHPRSFETRLIDDENEEFLRQARCQDLLVLGQTDPEEPAPAGGLDFPERVLLNAGRPVLVVPYAGQFDRVGSKAMIAWDGGIAATRAVASALPLLGKADVVEVVEVVAFNPGDPQRGPDIAQYLAHHQVRADVIRQQTDIDLGSALLSMASDLNSDTIIMGAFGHSRLREKIFGGVTRTVLRSMTVPVLMAH